MLAVWSDCVSIPGKSAVKLQKETNKNILNLIERWIIYQAVLRGALRQQTAFTLVLLAMERSVAMTYFIKLLFELLGADNDN